MILDLVRASNNQGILGFVADARRLNVLLSRQSHALTIVLTATIEASLCSLSLLQA